MRWRMPRELALYYTRAHLLKARVHACHMHEQRAFVCSNVCIIVIRRNRSSIFAPATAGAPGLQIDVTDVRVRLADAMAFVTCVFQSVFRSLI